MGAPAADASAVARTGRLRSALAVLALPALIAVIYGRALFAPFFFDDANTVLLNPTVQRPTSLRIMLAGTRPLLNLSFYGTYRVSGLSSWGHRLGNIVLHGLNVLLLYCWLRLTLRALNVAPAASQWVAWLAAALFAVHPLQVEAVTYISGRADVLTTSCALLSLLALAGAHRYRSRSWLSALCAAAAVLATIAAVASKESGVVMPIILLAYGCLLYGSLCAALRAHPLMYTCLIAPWLLSAYLLIRHPQYAQTAGLAFGRSEYGIAPLDYLYTQAGVIVHYFRLALLPVGQVFDYDWPVAASVTDALLPGVVLVACIAVGLFAARRSWLYPFAVLWIFATLAPTSSIVPIADVIAERRMYMPLVGVAVIIALVVRDVAGRLRQRGISPGWIAGCCGVVLLGFGGLAWARNGVWMDPITLWQDTISKQPSNPRAHTNLGIRYLQRGNVHDARLELETALDLVAAEESSLAIPRHGAFAATHLAIAYLELGDAVAAREAYEVARELGAESYRELEEPLQRVARTLAMVGQGDPDAR